MCDKAILENCGTLKSLTHCYKNQKICNKAVDIYVHAYIRNCYKTQKMCNKSVNTSPSAIEFVPECYKTQKMCIKAVLLFLIPFMIDARLKKFDKVVSNDPFMLKYCLDRYKSQELCDKAANDFLSALKFLPDWFVTSKMIKKIDDVLFAYDDILFFDEKDILFFDGCS